MAITLRELRRGLVEILPQNICNRENRPSKVSFMLGSRGELYHRYFKKRQKSVHRYCTMPSESRHKYFAVIKFCTQLLISMWKSEHVSRLNARSSIISPLCTIFVQTKKVCVRTIFCAKKSFTHIKLILGSLHDGASLGLIPLRRSVQMNLDRLLRARDVVPSPECFPSFRHNLYLYSSKRRIRDVRDSLTVGFHIEFELLVFRNFVFLDVLQINAGIFDRAFFIAAGDFNGYASVGQRALGLPLGNILCVADTISRHKHSKQARKPGSAHRTQVLHANETILYVSRLAVKFLPTLSAHETVARALIDS